MSRRDLSNNTKIIKYQDIVARTERAVLLELCDEDDDESKQVWFPFSQCELDEDECEIIVPDWLIYSEGLEAYVE